RRDTKAKRDWSSDVYYSDLGIWGGLFAFPQFETKMLLEQWLTEHGLENNKTEQLISFRHTFSHFHLDIVPICVKLSTFTSLMERSEERRVGKGETCSKQE